MCVDFVNAFQPYGPLTTRVVEGLQVVEHRTGRGHAVVLGHPLWRLGAANHNERQRTAVATLHRSGISHVTTSDLYTLDRAPFRVFAHLGQ